MTSPATSPHLKRALGVLAALAIVAGGAVLVFAPVRGQAEANSTPEARHERARPPEPPRTRPINAVPTPPNDEPVTLARTSAGRFENADDELSYLEERLEGEEQKLEIRVRSHEALRRALSDASRLTPAELAALSAREGVMERKRLDQAERVAQLEQRISDLEEGQPEP